MESDKALEHLLKIEAEAAALVIDAQAEADRRILESENKNRASYEERFRVEAQLKETALKKEKDRLKKQYQKALEDYRNEILNFNPDTEKFSALFNSFFSGAENA
ncbi:MAG: hypothetical protein LBH44_12755 [Treponema sp.]|jgi:vacuolar-type H+-ATPase subunit H|nr:hypothetical protein [Treponema sp.]